MSFMPGNDPPLPDVPFSLPGLGGLSKIFTGPYMPALTLAFSSGLKTLGAIKQGNALVQAAGRRQQAAEFEAQQMVVNAGQAKAEAQRAAYFKNLEGEQLISAILARAGAGSTDPTVLNVIGAALARKAYNVQAAIYGGEEKARLLETQAQAKRYDAALGMQDAKAGRKSYMLAAAGSLVEGAGFQQKYWPKNAPSQQAPAPVENRDYSGFDIDPNPGPW